MYLNVFILENICTPCNIHIT